MDDKYMEMRSLRRMVDEIENEDRRGVLITLVDDEVSVSLLGVSDFGAYSLLLVALKEAEARLEADALSKGVQ